MHQEQLFALQRPAAAAPVPVPLQHQAAQQVALGAPAQHILLQRPPVPQAPNADLLPQAGVNIPPAIQSTSQQSSDASCGFGGLAFSSAALPLRSSPPAHVALGQQALGHQAPPTPTLPMSAGIPGMQQQGLVEQPLDWALENLDQLDTQVNPLAVLSVQ